jgi:hypothetical protein
VEEAVSGGSQVSEARPGAPGVSMNNHRWLSSNVLIS